MKSHNSRLVTAVLLFVAYCSGLFGYAPAARAQSLDALLDTLDLTIANYDKYAAQKESRILALRRQLLQKRAVAAIREVDRKHIVILGGAIWNSVFDCFTDWTYDSRIMYSCHRYGGEPTADAIRSFIDFRDKTGLPMYMGELGHNTDEWQSRFVETMEQNNIGWTFWPYKKVDNSCWMGITRPAEWDSIVHFAEADRSSYELIRKARPSQALSRRLLREYLDNLAPSRCTVQRSYLHSIGLEPNKK